MLMLSSWSALFLGTSFMVWEGDTAMEVIKDRKWSRILGEVCHKGELQEGLDLM